MCDSGSVDPLRQTASVPCHHATVVLKGQLLSNIEEKLCPFRPSVLACGEGVALPDAVHLSVIHSSPFKKKTRECKRGLWRHLSPQSWSHTNILASLPTPQTQDLTQDSTWPKGELSTPLQTLQSTLSHCYTLQCPRAVRPPPPAPARRHTALL